MNTDEILKKLEEVKVEAFNNYHSADSKSVIQLPSETEVELEEDVRGEDTKKKPILGEKEKVPESLSRTTPMAGPTKFNTPKEVYTSGEKKSITTESIQAQLDDLKKNIPWKKDPKTGLMTQPQRPPDKGGIELKFDFTHRAGLNWYDETNIKEEFLKAVLNHPTLKQMGVKITKQGTKKVM